MGFAFCASTRWLVSSYCLLRGILRSAMDLKRGVGWGDYKDTQLCKDTSLGKLERISKKCRVFPEYYLLVTSWLVRDIPSNIQLNQMTQWEVGPVSAYFCAYYPVAQSRTLSCTGCPIRRAVLTFHYLYSLC